MITTDVGGLPEAVWHGKTGFVVPSRDSAALAGAITRFFEENRAGEFSRNIEEYNRIFSWSVAREAIERIAKDSADPQGKKQGDGEGL